MMSVFRKCMPVWWVLGIILVGPLFRNSNSDRSMAVPPEPSLSREQFSVSVYDRDPQHLWNRLHAALHLRVADDGQAYGHDELGPLLFPMSTYLLAGARHKLSLATLDEFLDQRGEKLIHKSLKRAMLQRDLWAIFDWLAHPEHEDYEERKHFISEQRELRVRIGRLIQRVALTAEEIRTLPDNYAAAVASKSFPTNHSPSHPDKAFLPPDLLDPKGPWVLVGSRHSHSVAAPTHASLVSGRSVFLVLMKLPEGREAAVAYLKKLSEFSDPVIFRPDSEQRGRISKSWNPDLPQFPVGTQLALVRQTMLIDDKGNITPTRITESVQIRVVREIPRIKKALSLDGRSFDEDAKQDGYEFRLHRGNLFAGRAGGLHALRANDREVFNMFVFHGEPFGRGFREESSRISETSPITENLHHRCAECHSRPGIFSVNSISTRKDPIETLKYLRDLQFETPGWQAMLLKKRTHSWGFMRGLLENG